MKSQEAPRGIEKSRTNHPPSEIQSRAKAQSRNELSHKALRQNRFRNVTPLGFRSPGEIIVASRPPRLGGLARGVLFLDQGYLRLTSALLRLAALALVVYGGGAALSPRASAKSAVTFTDARRQAAEFISYNRSIVLAPEQKKIMDEALSSIPAPCCAQFSIATCCCPCNLAKSTWGLSKFLIAKQHTTAPEVRAAAAEWLQFTNPGGYSGDACFTKGCNRPFEANGCGGMDERHIQ